MRWTVQRKRSRIDEHGRNYWEVVVEGRADRRKPSNGLGYLTDERAGRVEELMRTAPAWLFHGTKRQVRTWALSDACAAVETWVDNQEREAAERQLKDAERLAATRDYRT